MPDNTATLDTLFYPFESGLISLPDNTRILFLNAQYHSALSALPAQLTAQQFFKPYAERLEAHGFSVLPESPDENDFDVVVIHAPKNQIETLGLIAQGLSALKEGGLLVATAANTAGGKRLVKNAAHFGLENIISESRNKARVVWVQKTNPDQDAIKTALQNAAPQSILDGAFQSRPGIYGWDKMDQGSALLLQHLPGSLSSIGADFGCGYGALAQHVLDTCADIKELHCLDADWRAVEMARTNLLSPRTRGSSGSAVPDPGFRRDDIPVNFHWTDLTQAQSDLPPLDFIVMNPPFHEGKTTDISIGLRFIETAAQCLKPGGVLWMVANKHLPYEPALQQNFTRLEKPFEGQGFKIFCAVK